MKIFGFIGTGNMGGALAKAASKVVSTDAMLLSDGYAPVAESLAKEFGCKAVAVNTVAVSADLIWLGVKPQVMGSMLSGIAPYLAARTTPFVLVSMAAGVSIADIQMMAGGNYPVIRIMPNTPVMVGEGMILISSDPEKTDDAAEAAVVQFQEIMKGAGSFMSIPESSFDITTSIRCTLSYCTH